MNVDLNTILTGGDERIELKANQLNKYHVNQLHYKGLLNRGSCTVSTINPDSLKAIQTKIEIINEGKVPFLDLITEQRARLESYISLHGNFEIIFAPSGSDLVYLPILISKLLNPDKDIVNFITCPEELGSGSILAAEGQYFMDHNQFGEDVENGGTISEDLNIELLHFNARSNSGHILNHKQTITRELENYKHKSRILSLVVGSKSGIKDNLDVLDKIDSDVIRVIDLCQFRTNKEFLADLIDKECLVMITGSKFYQSPPFCGAMLVPKSIVAKLNKKLSENPETYNFESVFSYYDFPKSLYNIGKNFPKTPNYGLYLRWEAALTEMEKFYYTDFEEFNNQVLDWSAFIQEYFLSKPDDFHLMPNQDLTNDSIISFRVKKNGEFLTHEELKYLHQEFLRLPFDNPHFTSVNIGQPVQYSQKSFIRMAVGAYDIRKMMELPKGERMKPDEFLLNRLLQFKEELNFEAVNA